LIGAVCIPARAALYEFTLKGEVTYSNGFYDVSVGDPFAIKYIADSQDLDPDPSLGSYACTRAIAVFPRATVVSAGVLLPLTVSLNTALGTDRLYFLQPGPSYGFWFDLQCPAGTLGSDELPRTFALTTGIVPVFEVRSSQPRIDGIIDDYSAVPIHEPAIVCVFVFTITLQWGRRPHRRAAGP
jgi:hypothetical protein